MNIHLRRTLIALAVVSTFGVAQAYAHDEDGHSQVKISKKVELNSSVNINGDPSVDGKISVDAAALAVSNGTQSSIRNSVSNNGEVANSAQIGGNVGSGASGNIGVNQAAGDLNAQGNQGAIAAAGSSASDAGFTFNCEHSGGGCGGSDPGTSSGSMADAETFATQSNVFSRTSNRGTTNTADVSGHAFAGASGNIGVNQAAGDGNEQLNQLSAATAQNVAYAVATSALDQEWSGNRVDNDPGTLGWCSSPVNTSNSASLSGNVLAGASGNIGLNQAAGSGNLQSNSLAMGVSNP
jgi:hypothetical protein